MQFLTQNQTDNLQASILLDLYSQQLGCTLRNNSFYSALEGFYSYWANEHLPEKFSSALPFIPTTWCFLPTCHWTSSTPAAQELNIHEQGKASAGSSSFTNVSIIYSAFLASQKNPYVTLQCSTFWQGKCNLLKNLRWKYKVYLFLEPLAQISYPHLHFDQRNKEP